MIVSRVATYDDAHALAPRLRAGDRAEIAHLSGVSPLTALIASVNRSTEARSVVINDEVHAMYGYAADPLGRAAMVWAMGSDLLSKHRLTLIKEMKRFLDEVQRKHGRLVNIVDEENAPAIELLRRLGFNFGVPLLSAGGGRAMAFWRG